MSRYLIINPNNKIVNIILSEEMPSSEILNHNTAVLLDDVPSAAIGQYYISSSDTLIQLPDFSSTSSNETLSDLVNIEINFSRDIKSFDQNIVPSIEGVEIENSSITHDGNVVSFNLTTGSLSPLLDENIDIDINLKLSKIIDSDNRDFPNPIIISQHMFIPSSSVE